MSLHQAGLEDRNRSSCGIADAQPSGFSHRRAVGTAAARQPPSSSSSSSAAQPCPLHACLLRYRITDFEAFSEPKHLALSQEEVSSNFEPKLAALVAEGLRPKQISQLTATGTALAASQDDVAMYLSRAPSKVQQLLQWLDGSLGIGLKRLAACSNLCSVLSVSAGAANAVCSMLQMQQVPAAQVARLLLRQPTLFKYRPEILFARIGALQQHLGLGAAAALQVSISNPRLLSTNLEARLPPLLRFLGDYMAEEGAGRRLVRAQPALGTLTAKIAERCVGNLAARGYRQQQIREMIDKQPTLLGLDLDSLVQQQKLAWIKTRSAWPIEAFFEDPRCFMASTRRLAGRVALLRECGLQPDATPSNVARQSNVAFSAAVRERLASQQRKLRWASWAEWEEAWLGTEEGREWGFPPLKS
ncbi:hypothetical protein N2152v2_009942 [Parachlorella kessleri]